MHRSTYQRPMARAGTQWFEKAADLGDTRALALLGARKVLGVLEQRSTSNSHEGGPMTQATCTEQCTRAHPTTSLANVL